jgi:nucleotide-binding universal stress UspA family protein
MVNTVAVGTDGSETATKAVEFAVDLAKRYGARLVVISSYRPVSETQVFKDQADAPQEVQWEINPEQEVNDILAQAESHGHAAGLEVTTIATQGNPADVLITQSAEQGADIIVVGNKGMQRRILGSVPNTIAHKADCSVVIVKTT